MIATFSRLAVDIDAAASHAAIGQRILEIGLETSMSSYDATYLELALRRGLPLATLDSRLATAADAVGVEIFRP
jgi:predicted nucleic acid-binding protein